MESVIRRAGRRQEPQLRRFNAFSLDVLHRRILRGGQEEDLSSIEFALLQYMIDHPRTLLLYQDLYQNVWESFADRSARPAAPCGNRRRSRFRKGDVQRRQGPDF